ncbi:MAG TPA: DUF4381 domain-containing protein [Marinobacter sp.]|nr:DUF4381 domain-containing protein [Marinobacter sp.]
MNGQDPLAQLRDIHLPATGGWWPPAPGWWIVAALVLTALAVLIWYWHRHRRRNQWKRQAKSELSGLAQQARREPGWYSEINSLLKRVARQTHPDRHPEAMTGTQWVGFLLETLPEDRIASRPAAEALVAAVWQPKPELEPREALAFATRWLEAQL